jgi:hypothetical protein
MRIKHSIHALLLAFVPFTAPRRMLSQSRPVQSTFMHTAIRTACRAQLTRSIWPA